MIRTMIKELDDLELALETAQDEERDALLAKRAVLAQRFRNLTPEQKVLMARYPRRPKIDQYIGALFTDFFTQRGDRQCREDTSILGGIALFHGSRYERV